MLNCVGFFGGYDGNSYGVSWWWSVIGLCVNVSGMVCGSYKWDFICCFDGGFDEFIIFILF